MSIQSFFKSILLYQQIVKIHYVSATIFEVASFVSKAFYHLQNSFIVWCSKITQILLTCSQLEALYPKKWTWK